MNIVLLDDDISLLRSLSIILSRQGHDVHCFSHPKMALRAMSGPEAIRPDVVLVDLTLPSMTGIEFLDSVWPRLAPGCRKAIITGHAEQLTVDDLADAGIEAVFPKPLDLERIRDFAGGTSKRHANTR